MIDETPPQFSDEMVRRFLIGRLSSTEQSSFEQSLFTDNALEERVRLAELELSDDYAADRLSSPDRDAFQQRFLLTADRESKLIVSRALRSRFASAGVATRDSFGQQVVNLFDIRRHAWKYAFATLLLMLMLLVAGLLIKKEKSHLVDFVRPPRVVPKPSATTTPRYTNHSTNPPAPSHSEPSPSLPLHEGLATSVVLTPKTPLDSAPAISTTGDLIAVQLKLDQPLAESYEVNVVRVSGEFVFSANGLKPVESEMLGFEMPAGRLDPGAFRVELTRIDGDSKQSAGNYYFRIK